MELIGLFIAVVAVVAVALLWKKMSNENALREKLQQDGTNEITQKIIALDSFLKANAQTTNAQIAETRQSLNQSLETSLSNVRNEMQRIQEATTSNLSNVQQQIGERLDNAAKVIGGVKENLGELGRAAQEIKEVGQSVAKLDEILRSPKLRGGMGEAALNVMLQNALPEAGYGIQHRFKTGEIADAVIKTASGLVAVDSKFPFDNFRKMVEAQDDMQRAAFEKAFDRDVKARADEIARKYILPNEGTLDFAMMYLPAEPVYYNISAKANGTWEYCMEKKVIPCSPSTFYAYLITVATGLKGLQVEKNAQAIMRAVGRMVIDVDAAIASHQKAQTQIGYAVTNLGEVGTKLSTIKIAVQSAAAAEEK